MTIKDLQPWRLLSSLRAQARIFSLVVLGCTVVSLALAYTLPKRYKSRFVLTIYTKYFQNPLVRDFVSEVQDPSELRAQRESLIRQAIDETFLDTLGNKYGLYEYGENDHRRSRERDAIFHRIEIIPLSATTFRISFIGRTAEQAAGVAKDLLDQVTHVLLTERKRVLSSLRDTVRARMESMGLSVATTADPLGAVSTGALQAELSRLEMEIVSKGNQFTPQHPIMVQLRTRRDQIRKSIAGSGSTLPGDGGIRASGSATAEIASLDVYRDLLMKANYLAIAIDMENEKQITSFAVVERPQVPSGPLFPRKGVFALWGVLVGLLSCLGTAIHREARKVNAQRLSAETATRLGSMVLGTLPPLSWKRGVSRVQKTAPALRTVTSPISRTFGVEWQ